MCILCVVTRTEALNASTHIRLLPWTDYAWLEPMPGSNRRLAWTDAWLESTRGLKQWLAWTDAGPNKDRSPIRFHPIRRLPIDASCLQPALWKKCGFYISLVRTTVENLTLVLTICYLDVGECKLVQCTRNHCRLNLLNMVDIALLTEMPASSEAMRYWYQSTEYPHIVYYMQ